MFSPFVFGYFQLLLALHLKLRKRTNWSKWVGIPSFPSSLVSDAACGGYSYLAASYFQKCFFESCMVNVWLDGAVNSKIYSTVSLGPKVSSLSTGWALLQQQTGRRSEKCMRFLWEKGAHQTILPQYTTSRMYIQFSFRVQKVIGACYDAGDRQYLNIFSSLDPRQMLISGEHVVAIMTAA